ncbi:hypothetical protein D5R40_18535 [Okeania hirsuta]|uniref:Uncharacterized protein n=1 Tax=Okeania hirsuta TaxID=1458930 RepID=A0A3N6QBG4_9CYAN|nr:hypothetical protein D4Z78_25385 [Okeania hirsuta]RQH37036.1 hypothetical protein D5R40_18535 [Okeania hirsuta]
MGLIPDNLQGFNRVGGVYISIDHILAPTTDYFLNVIIDETLYFYLFLIAVEAKLRTFLNAQTSVRDYF